MHLYTVYSCMFYACNHAFQSLNDLLGPICPASINHQKHDWHPHMISNTTWAICVFCYFNKFKSFVLLNLLKYRAGVHYASHACFINHCVVTGVEEGQQWEQITAFRILKCIYIRSFTVCLLLYCMYVQLTITKCFCWYIVHVFFLSLHTSKKDF